MNLPDPENDPYACSICGCALGYMQRVKQAEYCGSCKHLSANGGNKD